MTRRFWRSTRSIFHTEKQKNWIGLSVIRNTTKTKIIKLAINQKPSINITYWVELKNELICFFFCSNKRVQIFQSMLWNVHLSTFIARFSTQSFYKYFWDLKKKKHKIFCGYTQNENLKDLYRVSFFVFWCNIYVMF